MAVGKDRTSAMLNEGITAGEAALGAAAPALCESIAWSARHEAVTQLPPSK
jgi:hypothetical protein